MYNQPFQPNSNIYGRLPYQNVIQVYGINSARQLNLPPNSSMFALDYDDEHIYAVFTDGAGTVSVKPYTLTPCEPQTGADGLVTIKQFNEWKEQVNERLSELAKPEQ